MPKKKVMLVEDDCGYAHALRDEIQQLAANLSPPCEVDIDICTSFDKAQDSLEHDPAKWSECDLIILDLHLVLSEQGVFDDFYGLSLARSIRGSCAKPRLVVMSDKVSKELGERFVAKLNERVQPGNKARFEVKIRDYCLLAQTLINDLATGRREGVTDNAMC